MPSTHMKVAAVQAEPCWLDVEAGITKAIKLIKEAAANGAELVGFPVRFSGLDHPFDYFDDCGILDRSAGFQGEPFFSI
jgi:predicted amidohydrolase